MKNFKNAINKLLRLRKTNPQIYSLPIGTGNSAWTLIYCPQSTHYYAMKMANADCIESGISFIRPAYRINPNTNKAEMDPLDGKKPRLFAVKTFNGDKKFNLTMAKNEAEALNEHQFSDWSFSIQGQPMIILDFYPGKTICDTDGTPNVQVLDNLSLKERFNLILQISAQFHEIHAQKHNKPSRIHVDVKGSNILIDVPKKGSVNARVIDFGSAKLLDNSEKAETGLIGVTLSTIPPEAISHSTKRYIKLDEKTGILNTKSDIYSLSAVFASILGAADPYTNRRGQIQTKDFYYDMQILHAQLTRGFDFSNMLNDQIADLPFKIASSGQVCAFANLSHIEAPNNKTILNYKELPELGYFLYKDQLLYVDKSKNKVSGRENTKPIPFNKKVSQLRQIKDTQELSQSHLALCMAIANYHHHDYIPVDNILRPLVDDFLGKMAENDDNIRPSSEEVLKFFTLVNKLVAIATTQDKTRTPVEIERRVRVALLQLYIISYNGWNIKIPIILPNNKINIEQTSPISEFDFDSLEENTELFDQFCQVFLDQNILNGNKALTQHSFHFLQIYSADKKLFDAIISKLKSHSIVQDNFKLNISSTVHILEEKHSEPNARNAIDQKVEDLLLRPSKEGAYAGLNVANKFLSLSAPLMACLLTEEFPIIFTENFKLKKEIFENKKFIEADFPDAFEKIKQKLPSDNFTDIETLLQNSPTASLFLSQNLDDQQQIDELLKHTCQLDKNLPISAHSETKLFNLYNEIISNKEYIIKITSQATYEKLFKIITTPILGKIQAYVDKIKVLDHKKYQKFSLFGLFGHKVGEKLKAANTLITAILTGEYQTFLQDLQQNTKQHSVLTQKTLGGVSKSMLAHLKTISLNSEKKHHQRGK